jgi:hypothetical protein
MSRRLLTLLLAVAVFYAGLSLAQEPAGQDQPPVRLKKKKPRGDDKPITEPDKPPDKKKDDKKEDKKVEQPEAEPVTPQEEEKEVFQRVVKNVHDVGERLAKNDLGEATRQTQRDILKDIESLIQRNENSGGGGDGGGQQDQNNGGADGENDNRQGGVGQQKQKGGQKSQGKANGKQKQRGGKSGSRGSKTRNKQGKGGKASAQSKSGGNKPEDGKDDKTGGKNGQNGKGGGGGGKDDRVRNKNADWDKRQWGHLPPSLRAEMDALSNPQPFIPKYDELIKRYYRTIAEQGRRKGE